MADYAKERTVEVLAPSSLDGSYEFFVNAGTNIVYKFAFLTKE
jgi:hypothetical protein